MSAPATIAELANLVRRSGLVEPEQLDEFLRQPEIDALPSDRPSKVARRLVRAGLLTSFQAEQFLRGKWRGFQLGRFRVLERLSSSELGQIFLCEDPQRHERVSIRVLPPLPEAPGATPARLYREARLAAGLRHPHLASQHDIESDGSTHLLVMPFLDGTSLERIIRKHGPMTAARAAHYIRQAALGLRHIHEAGLVHRDVRPENLHLDRQGTIRLLHVGLGAFLREHREALPNDRHAARSQANAPAYLAPEQKQPGAVVSGQADVYGLGATFCFLLTGQPPAAERSELWSQLPAEVTGVIEQMLAHDPTLRPPPAEVVELLAPLTATPLPPPADEEMPQLSPAARNAAPPPPMLARKPVIVAESPPPAARPPSADPIARWAAAIATNEEAMAQTNGQEPPPPGEAAEAESSDEDSAVEILLDAQDRETAEVPITEDEPEPSPAAVRLAETRPESPLARQRSAVRAPLPKPAAMPKPATSRGPTTAAPKRRRLPLVLLLALVGGVPAMGGLAFLAWHLLQEPEPTVPPPAEGSAVGKERLYEGAVEAVNADVVHGWAWDKNRPEGLIHVDIYDSATKLATVPADIYRQDLHSRGMGNGRHVFGFKLPAALKDGQEHWIHVRYAGTEVELPGSPKRVLLKAAP